MNTTTSQTTPLWPVIFAAVLAVSPWFAAQSHAADRPNVVWIVSEDNSHHYLKHFFESGAPAPNIEAMAAHGITFDHAFSNAPVCSVARSTLATGCLGPRIGTQFHRKHTIATLPQGPTNVLGTSPRRRLLHIKQFQNRLQRNALERSVGRIFANSKLEKTEESKPTLLPHGVARSVTRKFAAL